MALVAVAVIASPTLPLAQHRQRSASPPKLEYKPTQEGTRAASPGREATDVLDVRDKAIELPAVSAAVAEAAAVRERARAAGAIICEAGCIGEPGSIVSYVPAPAPPVQVAMMVPEPAKLEKAVMIEDTPATNAVVCLAGCDSEPAKIITVKMSGPYYIPPKVTAKIATPRIPGRVAKRAVKVAPHKAAVKKRNIKHKHADHLKPYARRSHQRRAELDAADETSIEGIFPNHVLAAAIVAPQKSIAPNADVIIAALSEDDLKSTPDVQGAAFATGSLQDKQKEPALAPPVATTSQIFPVKSTPGLSAIVVLAHRAAQDAKARNALRATSDDWFNRASREEARGELR